MPCVPAFVPLPFIKFPMAALPCPSPLPVLELEVVALVFVFLLVFLAAVAFFVAVVLVETSVFSDFLTAVLVSVPVKTLSFAVSFLMEVSG